MEAPQSGLFRITDRGRQFLAEKPSAIDRELLERFEELATSTKPNTTGLKPSPGIEEATPEEALQEAYDTLRGALAGDVLEAVKEASPEFFERLVVDLLVGMGYGGSRREAGKAIGRSGDEGIDGTIKEDPLGLDVICVQAKRWEATVGRPQIQKFAGALAGQKARKGVFITTSSFSREARQYAAAIVTKIILIDGTQLAGLMIDHGVGVAIEETFALKRIDTDYFTDD